MTKFFLIFIIGFLLYSVVSNFFYIDLIGGCFIKILPSWDFSFNQSIIKEGLTVLKNGSPSDYQNVCRRIDTIDPNVDCGNSEGGCYWRGNFKRISVSTANSIPSWVAAVIVHEVCHSQQDKENQPISEGKCYQEDDRILRTLSIF